MHCPACGQQQVSNETKFCSRCGMPLGLVAELLVHGGFLPQLAELYKNKQGLFTRKNGVVFSVIWFIFWVMMLPAFIGLAGGDEAAGVPAIFGLFTTIMLLIVSLAFLKKAPKNNARSLESFSGSPGNLYEPVSRSALPPQQSVPASSYAVPTAGRWRDTNDLEPSSVTESTTRLLKEDER